MKTKRTIRTMRRYGVNPSSIGFAGSKAPSGKSVRRILRMRAAKNRLSDKLFAAYGSKVSNLFCGHGMRFYVKSATRFLKAPKYVQMAWLSA